jgi:hypothetical protein
LNGRTYHYLPKTGGAGGLQYFTFDASQTQIAEHENSIISPTSRRQANLQTHFLQKLYTELLECNYFVQDCELVGSAIAHHSAPPSYSADIQLRANINIKTNVFDIAAITSDANTGERILTYKLKTCNKAKYIPSTSEFLEPLSYPLLFPYGENGWSTDIAKEIPFTTYLCCRMLCPEKRDSGEQLTSTNKADTRLIPINRFQLMARLGQLYLVDMTSRVIDFRLHFQKMNAAHFHGGQDLHGGAQDEDAVEHDNPNRAEYGRAPSGPSYLSQSMHGSRRHLREKARDALAIVSEYDHPTLFITLTCNPLWPEIQEMLLPGQVAFDRPDIVCRVFKARLDAFMHNLRNGKYFDDFETSPSGEHIRIVRRSVIYELHVIEYQHCGLPHAHIVLKLMNTPNFRTDGEAVSAWIDSHISACMPTLSKSSTEEDRAYFHLVTKHLVHECSTGVNGCKNDQGHCAKGYHDTFISEHTTFNTRGLPQYKRCVLDDLRVVPHHRLCALDWGGHAYIDYAGSSRCVLYLYKVRYDATLLNLLLFTNHQPYTLTVPLQRVEENKNASYQC